MNPCLQDDDDTSGMFKLHKRELTGDVRAASGETYRKRRGS